MVFIDDNLRVVEDFEATLTLHGIECLGVHFIAIASAPKVYSQKVAEFQYSAFKATGQVISNKEALASMWE